MLRVNILRGIILSAVMLNVIAPVKAPSVFSLGSIDSLTDSRSLVKKKRKQPSLFLSFCFIYFGQAKLV